MTEKMYTIIVCLSVIGTVFNILRSEGFDAYRLIYESRRPTKSRDIKLPRADEILRRCALFLLLVIWVGENISSNGSLDRNHYDDRIPNCPNDIAL